jgi:hypothetical protein
MRIIDDQRRLVEVGRIRLGHQVESRSGKKHPAALEAFRLTSRDRDRISEAAKLYGGTMTRWDNAPSGIPEWEVYTESDRFPVIVPPSAMGFSQSYELWSGGGCKRRCDGTTEYISDQPCLCDPANRECEPHTRLSVMMRDLKGLGVWRVDTTGWYAKLELKGQVETLEFFAGIGKPLPAILRLDRRVIKREGEPVKRFVVPVLDVDVTPGELLMGTVAVAPAAAPPALTPVPDNGSRSSSIADQVAASENLPSRRRASTPAIKATGIAPRTAAQRQPLPPNAWDAAEQDQAAGYGDPAAGGGQESPGQREQRGWDEQLAREQAEREQTEAEAYEAIDRAREAAETTQDQPRMITHGQLTALGTILSKRGYDHTDAGVRARLDFCMVLVRELMPDSPWKDRVLTTSKNLTFDEASALLSYFKREESKANQPAQQPDPPDTGCAEPVEQPVEEPPKDAVDNDSEQAVDDAEEEFYERMEREESANFDAGADADDSGQMSMI